VYAQYGNSSASARNSFLEVDFGRTENITVQIHLQSWSSRFRLQYIIAKHSIHSGENGIWVEYTCIHRLLVMEWISPLTLREVALCLKLLTTNYRANSLEWIHFRDESVAF